MGNEQTRNLASYAIQRTTMQTITLVYSDKTFKDDGSFELVERGEEVKARFISLTTSEIQRLVESGFTINSGVSISIVGELKVVPDYIKIDMDKLFRIVSYTFEQGVSIMTCDSLVGVVS